MSRFRVRAILFASFIACSIIFLILNPDFVSQLRTWLDSNRTVNLTLLILLFLLFTIFQIFVIPSGTAILLIAGAIFGPFIGALYFVAMLVASPPVYALAKTSPDHARRAVQHIMTTRLGHSWFETGLSAVHTRSIATVCLLRLMPVFPSAFAVLISAALGVSLKALILGAVLVGFIRPLAVSSIGYMMASVGTANTPYPTEVVYLLLGFSVATLLISFALLLYILRVQSGARH